MRATGWTVEQVRAAPARVVRAHFARIFVGLVWNPELARAAGTPIARSNYPDIKSYGEASRAKLEAVKMFDAMKAALWPEDADG